MRIPEKQLSMRIRSDMLARAVFNIRERCGYGNIASSVLDGAMAIVVALIPVALLLDVIKPL